MPTSSESLTAAKPLRIFFYKAQRLQPQQRQKLPVRDLLHIDSFIYLCFVLFLATTVKCVSPYVQEPSGNCINVLIDINNCGKINNVCPSTYTSCSAGLCSTLSSIKIINGTFIWAASVNGSVDDKYFTISVPFNITLYNTTTTSITVTTNGVICLQSCSTTFTETALPTSAFSGATILPYWDDLYIFVNTSQGIYFDKQGNTPNRTFIIEYYCSHYQQSTDYYNFQVVFFENMPGIVQFIYYEVTDEGASATVGIQGNEAKQ
ncbi:unnamed protein product [Rotaria sp. Silwood2]|nr:unnamed protein product [Rotaria sp. Silwood2]